MTSTLLRNVLPLYEFAQPRIYRAFERHGKSSKLAAQALTLGYYPEIHIVDLIKKFPKIPRTARGYFNPSVHRNAVFVHEDFAKLYEANPNGGDGRILEATTLHEMVHWARYQGGNPERADEEAGAEFEDEFWEVKGYRGGDWPNPVG